MAYLCGAVSERYFQKQRTEAIEMGKGSLVFAWLLERLGTTKGLEMSDLVLNSIELEMAQSTFTIYDAPGTRDYMKRIVAGLSQADCAILAVSAEMGEFEAGLSRSSGMTREHSCLAYTLGVRNLIVAVNKMDGRSVGYNQDRYNEIQLECKAFFKKFGYTPDRIQIVPISGWKGENMKARSTNMPWYNGPTLFGALENIVHHLRPNQSGIQCELIRPAEKPLRIPIQNIYNISGVGAVAVGKIQSGIIKPGMKISLSPGKNIYECRELEINHQKVQQAGPGDLVGFNLKGIEPKDLKRGYLASDANREPATQVTEFLAQVIILGHPSKLTNGFTPMVYCHSASVACKFLEIQNKIDSKTGRVTEEIPASVKNGDIATILLRPIKPMAVEPHQDFPTLGRICIKDQRQTVAVGIVKTVTRKGQTNQTPEQPKTDQIKFAID